MIDDRLHISFPIYINLFVSECMLIDDKEGG